MSVPFDVIPIHYVDMRAICQSEARWTRSDITDEVEGGHSEESGVDLSYIYVRRMEEDTSLYPSG